MSASIVSFIRRAVNRDWSTQELAEFYRVEAALLQSGMRVSSDRGVTDEGDPWFVFCRADDEEVLIHFARIDGRYLISAPGFGGNVTGHNFNALIRDLVERQPVLQAPRPRGNVVLHPSALLVMLVATLLLKSGHAAEAAAAKLQDDHTGSTDRELSQADLALINHAVTNLNSGAHETTAVLSAAVFAAAMFDDTSMPTMVISAPPPPQTDAVVLPSALLAPASDDATDRFVPSHGSSVAAAQPVPSMVTISASAASHDNDGMSWHQPAVAAASGVDIKIDLGGVTLDQALKAIPLPPVSAAEPVVEASSFGGATVGSHDLAESLLKAFAGQQPIIHADTVPDALNAPLQQSAHTNAGTASPPPAAHTPDAPAPQVIVPAVTTTTAATPSAPVVANAPAPVVTTSETTQATPAVTPAPQTWPDLDKVLAIMQTFAKDVGTHLAVVVTGNQVIEYDYYAVDHAPASVTAVTYDFPDGSHLSLVGLPSELPHTTV